MVKRIVCWFMVSFLLMLWPVESVGAQEGEKKLVVLLEELYVFPDKGEEFERLFKELNAVFVTHQYPYRLDTYKMDDLRYLTIWWVDGMAGVDKLGAAWEVTAEKWGEEPSSEWLTKVYATMSHWETSVWIPRVDLSYLPENQADEYSYIVWGLLPIKSGHKEQAEQLFKEYVDLFARHEVPHAWSAAEGYIGVEFPILGFVEWAASPGSYWVRHDETEDNKERFAESAVLWEKMLPHIRGFEWAAGRYLKELSYRPAKKLAEEE